MRKVIFGLFFLSISLSSCKKDDAVHAEDDIVHKEVGETYFLIRDVEVLKTSNDEVSKRITSILSGEIEETIISTGEKLYDLNDDQIIDIGFEIIDLRDFNGKDFPEHFDHLAARVIHKQVEILDNSTYGYPDALVEGNKIASNGHWSTRATSVLGTFAGAGNFNGKGDKYLGFRYFDEDDYHYGWVQLNCSQHNDTLRIIDYGYNNTRGNSIKAGQTN